MSEYEKDCLFCQLIHGEIPAYKWHEDELFTAVLDPFPKCKGHTLIIPKNHFAALYDLPAEYAAKLMPLAQALAERMRNVMKFPGFNLLQNNGEVAGQMIHHFHLHIIPRYDAHDLTLQWITISPTPEDFKATLALLEQPR
jgi:histidine triad (HIT) family protein